MQDEQLLRYSRHILLDEIGIEGQQKLLDAHVLLIGAGGLGCPAAMYLAAAGVGKITLVDADTVDLTNLQRQIGHSTGAVGEAKVASLARSLQALNPHTEVQALAQRADAALLQQLLPGVSVVLDCSDNFPTRQAVNQACVAHGVPLVSGAAIGFDAQIGVFESRDPAAPCYACLFPAHEAPPETQCATMGVFAPLVGIVGAMQAAQALQLITGAGVPLRGQLLMLDGRRMEWSRIGVQRSPGCSVCGTRINTDLAP